MIEEALRAIAEPRRLEILRVVHRGELSAGEIASRFDVTRPAISQHLKVLYAAGLVSVRKAGTRRLYQSRPEGLAELKAFLDEFWSDRLSALKEVAEAEERRNETMATTSENAIQHEVRIQAKPETIFPFFTEPDLMVQWNGTTATLDARPGGVYHVNVNGRDVAKGEYVEITPYSRVVFTWGWEGEGQAVPPGASTVEVSLIPEGDSTLVRLRHYGLPADLHEIHLQGWVHYMGRLNTAAEGGEPGRDPMIDAQ